jgi:hypothetical protein
MKRRKKKEETLNDVIKELADECKSTGHRNLAIVLYAYLGSDKAGLGHLYAEHCQDFAKTGLDLIKQAKEDKTRRNN